MKATEIAPVVLSLEVPLQPAEAFDLFTRRTAEWWPLDSYSVFQKAAGTCEIEPRQGGRIFERSTSGEENEWGRVLVWDPPRRFACTWHPSGGPETHVEVQFEPHAAGTRVTLEHRGWEVLGDKAAERREQYVNGWAVVFGERFGRAAGV